MHAWRARDEQEMSRRLRDPSVGDPEYADVALYVEVTPPFHGARAGAMSRDVTSGCRPHRDTVLRLDAGRGGLNAMTLAKMVTSV